MRIISRSAAFKKDFKRLQKRGVDMRQLHQVIAAIASGQMLDQQYKDHPLKGAYGGFENVMLPRIGCWFI